MSSAVRAGHIPVALLRKIPPHQISGKTLFHSHHPVSLPKQSSVFTCSDGHGLRYVSNNIGGLNGPGTNTSIENSECPQCSAPMSRIGQGRYLTCKNQHTKHIYRRDFSKEAIGYKEEFEQDSNDDGNAGLKLLPPVELHKYLNKFVVGQDNAKMVLSVAVYNHFKRINYGMKRTVKESSQRLATDEFHMHGDRTSLYFTHNSSIGLQDNSLGAHMPEEQKQQKQHQSIQLVNEEVHLEKANILMLGPTGCGKTLLAETLAKILNVPFAICDCTTLTQAGYVGEDIESCIGRLLQRANNDVEQCQIGIVFLDEVDKIGSVPGYHQLRDVGGEGVQQGLLKLLEGTEVNVPANNNKRSRGESVTVDTTNILFIASGAFNGLDRIISRRLHEKYLGFSASGQQQGRRAATLDDQKHVGDTDDAEAENNERDRLLAKVEPRDIIEFGMIPEFIGRIPNTVAFHSLNKDMLVNILTDTNNNLVAQYKKTFEYDKIELEFDEDALEEIAQKALNRKIGARALRAVMEEVLLKPMYETPQKNIKKVKITADYVKGIDGSPQYEYFEDEKTSLLTDTTDPHVEHAPKRKVKL
ncbi:uncharacterized protein LOC106151237 isoform X2 [Lingula anatina]|uniref:Uncharacterized protein LOC106151237 isoform X2 n=1 Tax=Lingula anatina TaxID=7574 RepID=A0A1S3H110_LINAN|nr:uncharacterized protein LOC106151237 isoform X2 [Lingula anatina]|eukprot:XP_013379830.1 uncharacterized protein LOC106151237 isoform X2 [Lingula anatina]